DGPLGANAALDRRQRPEEAGDGRGADDQYRPVAGRPDAPRPLRLRGHPARISEELPVAVTDRRPVRHLRICCIAETVRCGVGRHLVDLVEGMTSRGHEVHLLHSFDRTDSSLLRKIERMPGTRCRAFAMRREPHWSDIGILYALARYMRRWGPFDVIHGHSSKGGAYGRLLAPFVSG